MMNMEEDKYDVNEDGRCVGKDAYGGVGTDGSFIYFVFTIHHRFANR
jgi:hypothetical protein